MDMIANMANSYDSFYLAWLLWRSVVMKKGWTA